MLFNALILEDHTDTSDWLMGLLQEALGPIDTIVTAATLNEARCYLRGHRFRLALIDISLPDGSGIEIIQDLKQINMETYCVITTIFDDNDHIFSALKAGADGYLLKEQPREKLITLLQGIKGGEPPISPPIARRLLHHFREPAVSVNEEFFEVSLSPRESEILKLVATGMTRKEIAKALKITSNTVAGYIKAIYLKLNISTKAEATVEAARRKLISIEDSY